MSGPLVGLVIQHGPEDHNAFVVLVVIAEDLRGPMRSCRLTNEQLMEATRLSRSAVKRALMVLVRDKWIARTAGERRGYASTYRLRLETFPYEAVDNVLERGPHRTPNAGLDELLGVPTEPLKARKGSSQTLIGVLTEPPSVSVTTAVPEPSDDEGAAEDPLPIWVGVKAAKPEPPCSACGGSGWEDPEADVLAKCSACRPANGSKREMEAAPPPAIERKNGSAAAALYARAGRFG